MRQRHEKAIDARCRVLSKWPNHDRAELDRIDAWLDRDSERWIAYQERTNPVWKPEDAPLLSGTTPKDEDDFFERRDLVWKRMLAEQPGLADLTVDTPDKGTP